ncbi:MAG: hydrolase, partial [Myxococcota bacterium]
PRPRRRNRLLPRFDPQPWDRQDQTWNDRLFVKDRVRAILHIPLNFGGVMTRNMTRIEAAGVKADGLVLSDENSLWGSDVYIGVDKDLPGADMQRLSGTFLSRVFEGPYSQIGRWMGEMQAYVKERGVTPKKYWFYYTTCPKCAKAYGKNYVVILAQV